MKRFYKPPFRKFVKKQSRALQLSIEDEIEKIAENPAIGEAKMGDLQGFQVHKFSYKKQKFLIAYRVFKTEILFYQVGTHENFYRNLKKYLKEGN
jgi:hypothetical protein